MPSDSNNIQNDTNTSRPTFEAQSTPVSPVVLPIQSGKKKKSSRGKMLPIFGAIGAVLLIAGGTITFLMLNNKTSEPVVKSNTVDLPALGDALKATAKEQSTVSAVIDNVSPIPDLISKIGNSVWIHPDDGASQLTYYSRQATVADSEADYEAAVSYLKANNFSEITLNDKAVTNRFFSSDTAVCVLKKGQSAPSTGAIGDNGSSNAINVYCASKKDFAKNEEKFKPYADLYEANDTDVIFRTVVAQSSTVKDYKNASLTIAKVSEPTKYHTARFYQTPDQNWHYLATSDSQDSMDCNVFATDEIKSAFIGTPCWDSTTSKSQFVHFPINSAENDPNADPADE